MELERRTLFRVDRVTLEIRREEHPVLVNGDVAQVVCTHYDDLMWLNPGIDEHSDFFSTYEKAHAFLQQLLENDIKSAEQQITYQQSVIKRATDYIEQAKDQRKTAEKSLEGLQ